MELVHVRLVIMALGLVLMVTGSVLRRFEGGTVRPGVGRALQGVGLAAALVYLVLFALD